MSISSAPVDQPTRSELPIFELPLALVPAERVPLHIFEPRYRLMIADCIEHDAAFGIVFRDEDGARAIGCTALVADVTERHDDGRMDIVVRGEAPFRVLERFAADDWPAASVEMIAVEEPAAEPTAELEAAREAFAKLLEAVGADPARAAAVPSRSPSDPGLAQSIFGIAPGLWPLPRARSASRRAFRSPARSRRREAASVRRRSRSSSSSSSRCLSIAGISIWAAIG